MQRFEEVTKYVMLIVCTAVLVYGGWNMSSWERSEAAVPVVEIEAVPEVTEPQAMLLTAEHYGISDYILQRNSRVSIAMSLVIAMTVIEAAEEYALPYPVLLALMEVESTFDRTAVSPATALGLMQIHTATWAEYLIENQLIFEEKDLFDPVHNIYAGAYILKKYYEAAERSGVRDPMHRAITRYYGGTVNGHYDKVCRALGRYKMFLIAQGG